MDDYFYVDTIKIKEELNNMDLAQLSENIEKSFGLINNFNNNWSDNYTKSSEKFKTKIDSYHTSIDQIYEEMSLLKSDILNKMDDYERIEKSTENWE